MPEDNEANSNVPASPPPEAPPAGPQGEPFVDPGGEHLAAALRTSFRLLGFIMIAAIGAFFAMGIDCVQPGEVAIRTVFGEVVGTTEKGLAYNWPSPIGRIEKISVAERTVRLGDFWLHETPRDKLKDLRKRKTPTGGLRPGLDGALVTGDRNLLHVRLECRYAIGRQWDPKDRDPDRRKDPVLLYRLNVRDPNETVRSVLCSAAIQAAATRTADGLQRTERAAFEQDVARRAQAELDELKTGLLVRAVKVEQSTWPVRTLADYDEAQRAVNEADARRNRALKEAVGILTAAAGADAYPKLVGDPRDVVAGPRARALRLRRPGGDEDYNLIGRYNEAARRGDETQAARILQRIDDVLVSRKTGGEVTRLIGEAQAYSTATREAVQRRVQRFQKLLPEYEKAPEFMIHQLWQETREAILSSPLTEKHYVAPGDGKTVLRVDRDPDIVKQIRRAWLRKQKQAKAPEAGTTERPRP